MTSTFFSPHLLANYERLYKKEIAASSNRVRLQDRQRMVSPFQRLGVLHEVEDQPLAKNPYREVIEKGVIPKRLDAQKVTRQS